MKSSGSGRGWSGRWPLLLFAAISLRFAFLDRHDLWADEAVAVYKSTRPSVLQTCAAIQAEVPLYPLLLAAWVKLGTSVAWLRASSAVLGSCGLVWLHLLARRHFGQRTGIAVLLVAGSSSFLLYYSQEVRTYALFFLLSCALLDGFLRLAWNAGASFPRSAWIHYASAAVLGLYQHYYAFPLVGSCYLAGFAFPTLRRHWRSWLVLHLLIALAFVPWLPNFFDSAHKSSTIDFMGRQKYLGRDFAAPFVVFSLGKSLIPTAGSPSFAWESTVFALGLVAAGGLVAFGIHGLCRGGRRDFLVLAVLVMIVPLLASILVTRLGVPLYNYTRVKYLIFSCPLWFLLIALGVDRLVEQGRRPLACVLLSLVVLANAVSIGNYFLNPEFLRAPEYGAATRWLRAHVAEGEPVVCSDAASLYPLWYYLGPDRGVDSVISASAPELSGPFPSVSSPQELSGAESFWLVNFRDWRKRAQGAESAPTSGWVDGHWPVIEEKTFRGLVLEHRKRTP